MKFFVKGLRFLVQNFGQLAGFKNWTRGSIGTPIIGLIVSDTKNQGSIKCNFLGGGVFADSNRENWPP